MPEQEERYDVGNDDKCQTACNECAEKAADQRHAEIDQRIDESHLGHVDDPLGDAHVVSDGPFEQVAANLVGGRVGSFRHLAGEDYSVAYNFSCRHFRFP